MAAGCTHITAVNFDPTATSWDHSCQYLLSVDPIDGTGPYCLLFEDVEEMTDQSFTVSYSLEKDNWVFFHDYFPNIYFHTRTKLMSIGETDLFGKRLFEHNSARPGKYYELTAQPKSFFVDVIFKTDFELILDTVNWISSVLNNTSDHSARGSEWYTLTHITIWNSQQHTGRIALRDIFKDLQYATSRKVNGKWSLNDFRNVLETRGSQFLGTLFEDYALQGTPQTKSWYDKEFLQDKYFIIRFEFDNSSDIQLALHDTSIQATKAKR